MSTATATAAARLTPVRRQYLTIKHSYPDAILLFRMGDFYECFDADAQTLAAALEIALTSRTMGRDTRVPMAGVPAVSLDTNLARLIKQGHKVAICEQLSDPALSKGLVERGVVRVVTPGTVLEAALLDHKANNYLAAVCAAPDPAGIDQAGIAWVDVTTGEFTAAQFPLERLPLELARIQPAEILTPSAADPPDWLDAVPPEIKPTAVDPASFNPDIARQTLLDYYGVLTLEPYGIADQPLAVRAAGAIVDYLRYAYKGEHPRLAPPSAYSAAAYMTLDPQTRRNLELFAAGRWNSNDWSLLSALDDTATPMGARLLRRWLGQPLLEIAPLERRLDAVQFFYADAFRRSAAAAALASIADLERIMSRIQTQTALPRDLLALRNSLDAARRLESVLTGADSNANTNTDSDTDNIAWLSSRLKPAPEVEALIDDALAAEPSGAVGEGGVIRTGFCPDLDRLRNLSRDARSFIAGLESRERERTGIRSLKVGYNQVFGYYIEVSRPNLDAVPPDYQRRQTLTGGERFITPELKEYESQVLDARERMEDLERTLYRQVCRQIADQGAAIARLAAAIARADVFASLAAVAVRHGYVRPILADDGAVSISGIRSLKVGYNQVFGYYIEVSRPNLDAVPPDYQRRQTLTGGERFITPELKEYESQVLDARERMEDLERTLYRQVCRQIADQGAAIARLAAAIARADVFASLAAVAVRHGYVRPILADDGAVSISGGRHPVVERVLDAGAYVPNDAALDAQDAQIMLITGPNMAGKSTYIRQVALIVLLAQIGSFVPADRAQIGLVDRIFTRVGLQDDLATGQSTFMVEMVETAAILNQATHKSLLVLDEIGRGTSTYDGLAIAHAVIEHLHNNPRLGCKTLFATHYHELTELAATLPGVRNYRVAVAEADGRIAFLRRIVPGGADRSYGVHVANLAGMPPAVVNRARELLTELESNANAGPNRRRLPNPTPSPQMAMPLFTPADDDLVDTLLEVDIGNLTPLEAINKLYQLQEQARLLQR